MCSACGFKWEAVAPAGTRALSCPECDQSAGAWRYGIFPQAGDTALNCVCCGGCLFVVLVDAIVCATCGYV